MRRFLALVSVLSLASAAQADVIKPNDVRATSQFGVGLNVQNLVNGDSGPAVGLPHYGLIPGGDPGAADDLHAVYGAQTPQVPDEYGWISGCNDAGIPGGDPGVDCGVDPFAVADVDDQIVEFQLDGAYDLTQMYIWNDNEDGFAPDRGVDEFELQVSTDRVGDTFTAVGTTYNVAAYDGFDPEAAEIIPLVASGVRRVRILINTHHAVNPAEAYVGLAEVRFEGTIVDQDPTADATKDGLSGGDDFLILQQNLGLGEIETEFNSTLAATEKSGDFDNNNVVNSDDFGAWGADYGSSAPAAAAAAGVPEPATLLLASLALAAAGAARRRWAGWR